MVSIVRAKDNGYVVKDKKTGQYFCGKNNWDDRLCKAKIYNWESHAKEALTYISRSRDDIEIVPIIIFEECQRKEEQ